MEILIREIRIYLVSFGSLHCKQRQTLLPKTSVKIPYTGIIHRRSNK